MFCKVGVRILILSMLAFILLYSVTSAFRSMVSQVAAAARSTNSFSNLSEKILNNKAAALNNLGKYNESLLYAAKVLAIHPNNVDALSSKGVALDHLGNYTGAIEYYDKALAIDPKYVPALNNKGVVLRGLGNFTGAIEYYDKALAINPKYKAALDNKALLEQYLGGLKNERAKYLKNI